MCNMNILLFASDKKYVNYLKNVHEELFNRNHNSFFLYTESELTSTDLSNYSYHYNKEVDLTKGILSKSLFNLHLPFVPDFVFLARERWQPEQNIIKEFKEVFGSKVVLLEVNSNLIQVYESVLEMYSRNQYPQNMCDYYFEHSDFVLQNRVDAGFENSSKSIIVGNPKYDDLMDNKPSKKVIDKFNKKYDLNSNKEKILWFSNQSLTRDECLDLLRNFAKTHGDEYEILYKAFPNEPNEPRYSDYFNHTDNGVEFNIPKVTLFTDDDDLLTAVHLCDTHIGIISSVLYFPLLLGKKVVSLNMSTTYDNYTNLDMLYRKSSDMAAGETGVAADFWKRVFNLNSDEELLDIINPKRMEEFKKHNDNVISSIFARNTIMWDDEFKFLKKDIVDNKELLNLFDNFNDGEASKRIANELEKLL